MTEIDRLGGRHAMESIALWYFKQPLATGLPVWLGFMAIGVAAFVFSRRPLTRLSRVPYLTLLALVVLTLVIAKNLWNDASYAIADGRLWIPFLAHVATTAAAGYVLALIGTARSLDVKEHAKLAFLAFVPVVNVGFGFVPGAGDNPVKRAYFDDFKGPIGIAVLVVLVLMIPGARSVQRDNVEEARQTLAADPSRHIIDLKVGLALWGLDEMLAGMANQVARNHLPMRVDDQTVAVDVSATGDRIVYDYMIEASGWTMDDVVQDETIRSACGVEAVRILLDAGATVAYRFQTRASDDLGTLEVVSANCD